MSLARKHKTPPPPIGRKELERQQRQTAARQRMRFHTIVALTLMCFDKWRNNESVRDDIAALPMNEQKFLRMQAGKCHKRVQTVVQLLHKLQAWPAPNSAFFQDASATMIWLFETICKAPSFPETASYLELHAVMTYVCYAALRDWQAMQVRGNDTGSLCRRKEVRDMITAAGIFADHLIQPGNRLVAPVNEVYWGTRDRLHAGAPLPKWYEEEDDADKK